MAGAARRIEREKLFADAIAWNGAQLNALAFHKPAKMPGFDKFRGKRGGGGKRAGKVKTADDMTARLNSLRLIFGG